LVVITENDLDLRRDSEIVTSVLTGPRLIAVTFPLKRVARC